MNNRRKLLVALGAGALASPLSPLAQPATKVWRVGFLRVAAEFTQVDSDLRDGFLRGLKDLGYVGGKNLVIEWRFAEGKAERLPGLAAELVRLKVDVIVALGTTSTSAAQKATTTIPIVMVNVADPVASGLVKGLARPGGNITGLTDLTSELGPKNLEILLGIMPKLNRVAVLFDPVSSASVIILQSYQPAAQRAGVTILPMPAGNAVEIENAFSKMIRENARAVIVAGGNLFTQQMRQIAELAVKHRLLSASTNSPHVQGGLLMSYAPNSVDNYRRAAYFVDRIFKGAKPGDLPVEQPTKFELVINTKTAKALGITIPQSIMARADRVIE